MFTLFFTLMGLLIIPNVYAQENQEYNATSVIYDNLINVLLPLLIISAYKSSRFKNIIGGLEYILILLYLFSFPPIYNFFIYNIHSKYDYVCMISGFLVLFFLPSFIIFSKFFRNKWCKIILFYLYSLSLLPPFSFACTIFWIKKDDISEKIGHEWFIIVSL